MSDGVKFTGKYAKNADGTQGEPESMLPGAPARDIDGDEIKQLAKQAGTTPASFVKNLTASGLYREVAAEPTKAEKPADKDGN